MRRLHISNTCIRKTCQHGYSLHYHFRVVWELKQGPEDVREVAVPGYRFFILLTGIEFQ